MSESTARVICRDCRFVKVPMDLSDGFIGVTKAVKPFGVEAYEGNRWVITHLLTGMAVTGPMPKSKAQKFYRLIRKKCDWSVVTVQNSDQVIPKDVRDLCVKAAF